MPLYEFQRADCSGISEHIVASSDKTGSLTCTNCNELIDLFKSGGKERIAQEIKVPFLGRIPLDPEMVMRTDEDRAYVAHNPESKIAETFNAITESWKKRLDS